VRGLSPSLRAAAASAALHRPLEVARAPEGGQADDAAGGQPLFQLRRRGESVATGHLDVQQGHVREGVQGCGEHLVPARGLGDDLDVPFHTEKGRERPPRNALEFAHLPGRLLVLGGVGQELLCELALEGYQGEAVAEQVVQVPGEAQPLL
jgi:hypothetical protein